ncbi:hypothetical protein AC1031_011366 [Aphanomyces cochlioides]|nr:hypothetical protein AC1031_011366 [Aphanomyces cochlioides]
MAQIKEAMEKIAQATGGNTLHPPPPRTLHGSSKFAIYWLITILFALTFQVTLATKLPAPARDPMTISSRTDCATDHSSRTGAPSSSDDSDNSECVDVLLSTTPHLPSPTAHGASNTHHMRRPWVIHRTSVPPPVLGTEWGPRNNQHVRKIRDYEEYQGDSVSYVRRIYTYVTNRFERLPPTSQESVQKILEELGVWFLANKIDFLILSDSDLGTGRLTRSSKNDTPRPGLTSISNTGVAVLYDHHRWQDRIDARRITYSPSGCSLALPVHLGKRRRLLLIGPYCIDSPLLHPEEHKMNWTGLHPLWTMINTLESYTFLRLS